MPISTPRPATDSGRPGGSRDAWHEPRPFAWSPSSLHARSSRTALFLDYLSELLARVRQPRAVRPRGLRVAYRIERVGQRDGVEVVLVGIRDELRIDEEHHRHLALLARLEPLLGEAEAVDLGEIGAGRRGRHVVCRLAGGRPRRFVGDRIVDRRNLADPEIDRIDL